MNDDRSCLKVEVLSRHKARVTLSSINLACGRLSWSKTKSISMLRKVSVVVGLIVLAGSRGSPACLQVFYMTHMLRRYSAEPGMPAEKKSSR